MDYKQKYIEALERASKLRVQNPFDTVGQMVEHIFPELAESEDGKIRKEIIAFLYSKNGYMTPNEDWDFHNRWLAWLEKQNEQKIDNSNTMFNACINALRNVGHSHLADWLEKQGEQKPILDFKASDWHVSKVDRKIHNMCYSVDKVEPKFNVGDWVVLTAGELSTTLQIVNVDTNKKLYWFNDDSYLPIVDEECLHLWTIQDAKDGDVLVDEYNNIGLYSGEKDDLYWHSGIYLGCDDCLRGAMGYHKRKNTKPATKEQRDLLFSKMKEAGYEWRQEEKKPIKMKETKFKVGDWIVTDDSFGKIVRHVDEISSNIIDERYGLSDEYGLTYNLSFDKEHKWHKWTIQDASDGDVLASGDVIFIFNNIHGVWVRCHCSLRKDGSFKDRNYDLMYAKDSKEVYPATKEQRDLLFEKMKEAGYEWDAEKKALLKRDIGILPEAKMQAYIKYCNDKFPSNIFCDKCGKAVIIEREYPYFYDKDENDVYFASICPECGELLITKE